MNILMRIYPHKHKFIPIIYGLLPKYVDINGNRLEPSDYYEGGCVVEEDKFICSICGKRK